MRALTCGRALAVCLPLLAFLGLAPPPSGAAGFELGFEAEAGFGPVEWNGEAEWSYSASVEPSLDAILLPGLFFRASAGIEGENYLGDGGPAGLRASLPEALLSLRLGEGAFLRGGILLLPAGSDPFFRPAFWQSRFTANAYAKGGRSFLGAQAVFYAGDLKLGLLALPEPPFPVLGLFQKPTGSAAEARISSSLLGGSAALLGFGLSEPGSLAPRDSGLGFEAAFPLGDQADLRAEGLYDSDLAIALSCGATAFSLVELRAGYSYAENGSPSQDLSLTVALPRITDTLGFSVTALLCPLDLSSRLYAELFLETGGGASFHLRGEASASPAASAHGSGPVRASLTLLAGISHAEALR